MGQYELNNGRLKVKVAIGGDEYKRSRFDWSGMITEVVLDNKDKFTSKESLIDGDGSGGIGFFNEFGIEEPVGYDEVKVGESFPKIGIGLLTRDSDEKYDFFHDYEVEAFKRTVEVDDDTIVISVEPNEVKGYSVKYTKRISLIGNEMIVDYSLENVGDKVIDTTEYCHNFIAINDNQIGPDYSLSFSYPVELESKIGDFEVDENEILWTTPLGQMMYCRLKNYPKKGNQYFEVMHKPSGVGVRETSTFELERVAVWGMPHVISPEAFVRINVAPGESKCWKRVYSFFN